MSFLIWAILAKVADENRSAFEFYRKIKEEYDVP